MSFSRGGRDHGAGNPGSSGAGDAGGDHIGNLKHYFGFIYLDEPALCLSV